MPTVHMHHVLSSDGTEWACCVAGLGVAVRAVAVWRCLPCDAVQAVGGAGDEHVMVCARGPLKVLSGELTNMLFVGIQPAMPSDVRVRRVSVGVGVGSLRVFPAMSKQTSTSVRQHLLRATREERPNVKKRS